MLLIPDILNTGQAYVSYNSQGVSLEGLSIEDQYLWITTTNIVLQYLVGYYQVF